MQEGSLSSLIPASCALSVTHWCRTRADMSAVFKESCHLNTVGVNMELKRWISEDHKNNVRATVPRRGGSGRSKTSQHPFTTMHPELSKKSTGLHVTCVCDFLSLEAVEGKQSPKPLRNLFLRFPERREHPGPCRART